MKNPTSRAARAVKFAVIPASVLLAGCLVATTSYSAFSATTKNPTSGWAAGTVSLSNDSAQTAMFDAQNLAPGATGVNCIAVTSTGSLASAVRLYVTDLKTTNDLASSVTVTIREGEGGGFGSCDGFTASGPALYSGKLGGLAVYDSYANGIGTWEPTGEGEETRVFEISYALSEDAPAGVMGGSAGAGFTWEAQNR